MTTSLSGIGRGMTGLVHATGRHLAWWISRVVRRERAAAISETPYETALRTAFTARGWTFLLCADCGHVADWVTGGSHSCESPSSASPEGDGRAPGPIEDRAHADCDGLFDEIDEYLTSRDGRYDALVAALIIRSR